MSAQLPKLVNKQFNSPIGLYSENNIKEILDRESIMLANGVVGIDFHNPITTKPGNLHNSAVLRMLEEEENRQRNGQYTGFMKGTAPLRMWPPMGVTNHQRKYKDVIISGIKRVAWPPPREGEESEETSTEAQGVVENSPLSLVSGPTYQQSPEKVNTYQSPISETSTISDLHSPNINTKTESRNLINKPAVPVINQTLGLFGLSVNKSWASVQSPVKQDNFAIYQEIPKEIPNYHPAATILKPQNQQPYRQPTPPPAKQFEPPPSTITLRPKVPTSQAPAPVFTSQPATATLRGGKNLRGDLKWPPENVKDRMEAEVRQRMDLSKGPAFRPRKVQKDYSSFFAQHALGNTYPGYKIPPGTQYYDHHPVM